jgi:hypothetical protein
MRGAATGAVVAGVVGGIAGLILGLVAHPPTAWFAVFELGVPAAILGSLVGVTYGLAVSAVRTLRRPSK